MNCILFRPKRSRTTFIDLQTGNRSMLQHCLGDSSTFESHSTRRIEINIQSLNEVLIPVCWLMDKNVLSSFSGSQNCHREWLVYQWIFNSVSFPLRRLIYDEDTCCTSVYNFNEWRGLQFSVYHFKLPCTSAGRWIEKKNLVDGLNKFEETQLIENDIVNLFVYVAEERKSAALRTLYRWIFIGYLKMLVWYF